MTVSAASNLEKAATSYINTYNPGQQVCINDMSLPLGGKFDIHDDWQSPHISHDQGTAADVATVSKSGSCPASKVVNTSLFYAACVANNADRVRSIKHADHVHCNWAN
jgi:hypothetical protein